VDIESTVAAAPYVVLSSFQLVITSFVLLILHCVQVFILAKIDTLSPNDSS